MGHLTRLNSEAFSKENTVGWHTEVSGLKGRAERWIFQKTRGFRLKDVAETLVDATITYPFVAPAIRNYVLAPFKAKGLIFVHVPKNAGTSIGRSLFGPYGARLAHYTARFYRNLDPVFFFESPSFAILRDPVDRFLSAYFFIQNHGGDLIDLFPNWVEIYGSRNVADMSICRFIELHKQLQWHYRRLDYVVRPQAGFVCDEDGGVMVDTLFLMGRDDRRLRAFMDRWGALALPHLNRTARRELRLTPGQENRIRDLYPLDCKLVDRLR